MLLEFFRGTPHEALIAETAMGQADDPDFETLEAMLGDSIDGLRRQRIGREIAQRKNELSAEELRDLIARKHAPKPPSSEPRM